MNKPYARATAAALTVLTTAALTLTSCDDNGGTTAPPPTASPTPPATSEPASPTPTETTSGPVEPEMPDEARARSAAGAKAFVEFYWATVNYAQTTGDLALLRSMATESCSGCRGGADSIAKVYRKGGRIIGGHWRLLKAVPLETAAGTWSVSTDVHVSRRRIVGAGSLNETSRAGTIDFLFGLDYRGGAWRVTFLDVA